MEVEPVEEAVGEGATRPCDFCGHPVEMGSVDEYDCPVCGEPSARELADESR